jgi:hydrogenase/urease accessory protein HupE
MIMPCQRVLLLFSLLVSGAASAHELRPAYLELREAAANEFTVLWKTPMRGEMRLALSPEFSGRTETLGPVMMRQTGGAAVQTWSLTAIEPLRGQSVRIAGLEGTMTDALVRMEFTDGSTWVKRLTPEKPAAEIPLQQGAWQLATVYLGMGYEHILLGVDHLLFVLGLLLIVRSGMTLIKTITAFTLAHSLTLGASTLGYVSVPLPPLNVAIALSILFLGPEIVRVWRGQTSLTIRRPWVVALAFGLLHGFGFASGLSTAGMAPAAVPQALLWFNVGVELGQLSFVGLILLLWRAFGILEVRWPVWVAKAPGYAVGICGAFWFIQRTVLMMGGEVA